MNFFTKLDNCIQENNSLLCVGLDPNVAQVPSRYFEKDIEAQDSPITPDVMQALLDWNQSIIEETSKLVCAYKPNIAFYEALGLPGYELLTQILTFIPDAIPVLLDAKRGDIGSTATAYARACFEQWGVDGVTLSPYLGRDSVTPFAEYEDKGLFILCHTSNPSATEFQLLEINDWQTLDREPNQPLYIHVARTAPQWSPNVGLVVGATYPEAMVDIRAAAPEAWFLVPGIGAQGGDLQSTLEAGLRKDGLGLIINVSRGVSLAADHGAAAKQVRDEINEIRGRLR
ncbi:MAG: orotidine-5'-phosphate decarboxylase [Chloroflexota bacterium]